METEYLPEFQGTYLEDSYFLGLVAEGRDLRLKMLFALTVDHPAYAPPKPGEQHCYREGSILISRPKIVEWQAGRPAVHSDPDGTFDLGFFELHLHAPSRFRFVTQWFDATVETPQVSVDLA